MNSKTFFIFIIIYSFPLIAHQPILNNEKVMSIKSPYIIENPEISKAIYATLNGESHYYEISSNEKFNFYVGLNVAKISECKNFERFSFSILDENLNEIKFFDGQKFNWWEWYEEYGKKWYWVGPEFGNNFKSTNVFDPGTYYINVFNESNYGNYVLAVGDIEKFTSAVIAKMIFTLPKINNKFWNKNNCK